MTNSMKTLSLSVCSTQSALIDILRNKCPLITLSLIYQSWNFLSHIAIKYITL